MSHETQIRREYRAAASPKHRELIERAFRTEFYKARSDRIDSDVDALVAECNAAWAKVAA